MGIILAALYRSDSKGDPTGIRIVYALVVYSNPKKNLLQFNFLRCIRMGGSPEVMGNNPAFSGRPDERATQ